MRNPSPRPGGERPGLGACDGAHRSTVVGSAVGGPGKEDGVLNGYVEELKDMFKIFDADESGAIDPKEIKEQMTALGFTAENETVYQLISDLDTDGSQKIEFEEFYEMMTQHLGIQRPENNKRLDIMEMFDFIDDLDPEHRDQRIDVSNLEKIARVLGDDISREELEVMISGADKSGKGYVSADDFYELMISCTQRIEEQTTLRAHEEGLRKHSDSPFANEDMRVRRHSLDPHELQALGRTPPSAEPSSPHTPTSPIRSSLAQTRPSEMRLVRKQTRLVGFSEDSGEDKA